MKIASIEPILVNVSEKTNWLFLRVRTDDGVEGLGEATLNRGWEYVQLACLDRLRPSLIGKTFEEVVPHLKAYPHSWGGLSANTIVSALEQALVDIRARVAGVPVHALFGTPLRQTFRIYANVNRMTNDRSAAGFAKSAQAKVAEGLTAIKIAPFDNVYWKELHTPEGKKNLGIGIERVFAVREAIGPDVDLMIDCHWRFDEHAACQVLKELEPAKLFWAECLVSERPEHHAELGRVRAFAEERGVRLAGVERQVGVMGLEAFIRGKLLDVVMSDIKYAGGYSEMLHISERTAEVGMQMAPHNPSGPVGTFANLHFCSLIPNFLILEHQTEGTRYRDIVVGGHPQPVDGCFSLPMSPGLGLELNMDAIRVHPYKVPVAEPWDDPRLG